jgi:hypothetical protein
VPNEFEQVEFGDILASEQSCKFPEQRCHHFLAKLPPLQKGFLGSDGDHSEILLAETHIAVVDILQNFEDSRGCFKVVHVVDRKGAVEQTFGSEGHSESRLESVLVAGLQPEVAVVEVGGVEVVDQSLGEGDVDQMGIGENALEYIRKEFGVRSFGEQLEIDVVNFLQESTV